MPNLSSTYKAPWYRLGNAHLQTVLPSMFRKVGLPNYRRERLELSDGDFLDIDWHRKGNERLVIVCHGLEGSADRHYVKGPIKLLAQQGWDGLAINFRSCSGEMNRALRMYHHGEIEDLEHLIGLAEGKGYTHIDLVGFSLGGSVVMNYLGKKAGQLPKSIRKAVAVSVPFDLAKSGAVLEPASLWFYRKKFLSKLMAKMEQKAQQYPDKIPFPPPYPIRYFRQFDDIYTSAMCGFNGADDYYQKVSVNQVADHINIPTLVLNALNDPFLSPESFPHEWAKNNPFIHLETPEQGGHVGFEQKNSEFTYAEERIAEFLI